MGRRIYEPRGVGLGLRHQRREVAGEEEQAEQGQMDYEQYLDKSEFHTLAERLFLRCLLRHVSYRNLSVTVRPADADAYAAHRSFEELDSIIVSGGADELREEWAPLRAMKEGLRGVIRDRALKKLAAVGQPDIVFGLGEIDAYVDAMYPHKVAPA